MFASRCVQQSHYYFNSTGLASTNSAQEAEQVSSLERSTMLSHNTRKSDTLLVQCCVMNQAESRPAERSWIHDGEAEASIPSHHFRDSRGLFLHQLQVHDTRKRILICR